MSSFDLDGWDEFDRTLAKIIEDKYPKEAKKFLRKQVNNLKKDVKEDTPKHTGNLRKGWKVSVKGKKGAIKAEIKNSMPHAHLIENGHHTKDGGWWEGRHMLEKNIEKKKHEFEQEVNEFLNESLRELKL